MVGAGSTLATPALVRAQSQSGVALVIGNSKYKWEASLPNVKRDAPDIAKGFQSLDLKTQLLQDAGRDAMRRAIDEFVAASRGVELAAFYFAGHGVSWDDDTLLVPQDADLRDPGSVQSLVSTELFRRLAAKNHLLVYDNCRNNPADGWRQRDAMLSAAFRTNAASKALGPNTLALFSTAPGRAALDGPAGDNSPFAAALLRQLKAPPVDLRSLAGLLRRDILIATEGRQVVWAADTFAFGRTYLVGDASVLFGNASTAGTARIDPARIIELKKAYEYVRSRKDRLWIPDGLVAVRPPSGSAHGEKVGAYKFEGRDAIPGILIVMSADETQAEVIFAFGNQTARVFTGTFSQGHLILSGSLIGNGIGSSPAFTWRDANSGSVTIPFQPPINTRFTRLDG